MHSILFVDDEKAILRSLKRLFRGVDWELYFAEDGMEALEIMSNHEIDMVISDMRMPKMDGHRLLREIQRLYPHTVRIILSGFSDEKEIYKSVLDGSAKNYLLKPWEPVELLDFVKHTFELREVLESKKIINFIQIAEPLPIFSSTKNELTLLFEREASLAEIADRIDKDLGISARVLQLINSSSYDKKIGSVKQAVFHIGKNVLKNIVFDTNYFYHVDASTDIGLRDMRIMRHAVFTNKILDLTYETFLNKVAPDIAVTAGLLHDIGMLLIEGTEASHEELGGYYLKWQGMPNEIVESALFHHNPLEASAENLEMIGCLHLANYYAAVFLGENDGTLDEKTFEALQINRERYEKSINSAVATWHVDQWN